MLAAGVDGSFVPVYDSPMTVEVVTMTGCGACSQAKKFLLAEGIPFTEVPHTHRPDLKSFPVLVIDRRPVFTGFDRTMWREKIRAHRPLALAEGRRPAGRAAPAQESSMVQAEPQQVGLTCGKRVTPQNVGTMLGAGVVSGLLGTEKTLPAIGIAGAFVYWLGATRYGCQVRAAGTGLMLGAVVAAVKHCVVEDMKDERDRARLAGGQP